MKQKNSPTKPEPPLSERPIAPAGRWSVAEHAPLPEAAEPMQNHDHFARRSDPCRKAVCSGETSGGKTQIENRRIPHLHRFHSASPKQREARHVNFGLSPAGKVNRLSA